MLVFIAGQDDRCEKAISDATETVFSDAEIKLFSNAEDVIDAIQKGNMTPSILFSEIKLPGINGLELVRQLQWISPNTKTIFVSERSEYALEAYQLHVSGYISKPVDSQRVMEELHYLSIPLRLDTSSYPSYPLFARCFGYFEIFWNGKPLPFQRHKSKELFAFLVDRKGAFCSSEQIISELWDENLDPDLAKHRLRNLTADLRATLRNIGYEDLLLSRRNQLAIHTERLGCDLYQMLSGDKKAEHDFLGEYMAQYSWAEPKKGDLYFKYIQKDTSLSKS